MTPAVLSQTPPETPDKNAPRVDFLDLAFDPLAPSDAARVIAAKAKSLAPFSYVVTPNVDHLVRLEMRPELYALYRAAWLTLNDSRILELFANATRLDLPAAPGADIVELLMAGHVDPAQPVTVIGGAALTVAALKARYGLADVRWFNAPQGLREDAAARAACTAFILANPSPFIFLAVGSPQQEMIAAETAARGGAVGVALCCGASLEFLSGETARAPKWMRDFRLEWLHRLTLEPKRMWRRYLVDGPRIFRIWMKWMSPVRVWD